MKTNDTTQKIKGFLRLPKGWHFGKGVAPSEAIAEIAVALAAEAVAKGFRATDAFPGTDGEIQVTAYHGSKYLEFTIDVHGSITFVHEDNEQEIDFERMLSIRNALQKIPWMPRESEWHLSGLSTVTTMIRKGVGSQALPSNPLAMGVESLLSTKLVSTTLGYLSASMLEDSTQDTTRPQFFGQFQSNSFLRGHLNIMP